MSSPLDITRPEDDRFARHSLPAGLQVSPMATRDDVIALATGRAAELLALVEFLAVAKPDVEYSPSEVMELVIGPVRDVAALCRIVNDMGRPTPTGTETSLAGCQPA